MRVRVVLLAAAMFSLAALISVAGAGQAQTGATSDKDINEGVLGRLRTINTAEVTYASTYTKGFSKTLAAMGETSAGEKVSASRADLIDRELATGKWNDTVFVYKPGKPDKDGAISSYTVTTRPAKWRKGLIRCYTDQSGVIRWTDQNRPANVKDKPIE